jgi:hypothetical protein
LSTVAALIVAYYAVNILLAWYMAGVRKTFEYTPSTAATYTVFTALVVWGVLSLDAG